MQRFNIGDYVETTGLCFGPGLEAHLTGTAGFVEHVFTDSSYGVYEDELCDNEGYYTEESGITYHFDDWKIEYSVRLSDGTLLMVFQVNLSPARHPLAEKQLALPMTWGGKS